MLSQSKFSPKMLYSLAHSNARINIWDGAVRSGKTITSIIRWLSFLASWKGQKQNFLMVGKTERTLKQNILDVIQDLIGEKNFKLNRGAGEVYIYGVKCYIVGANDERAEGKIRGLTLAGAYCDEITLYPESFFKMLLSRLSVPGAKLFGTTNPDSPFHWLKTDYLDRKGELDLKRFHFILDDNPNLPPEYVENLKKEYTGVWYKRFILGEWVLAEGLVYDMFNPDKHITQAPKDGYIDYWVGIDYGTVNPFVILLLGKHKNGKTYVLKEYYYDSKITGKQKTDPEYTEDLKAFIKDYPIKAIYVDPSAKSFIVQCQRERIPVYEANNEVLEGIRFVSKELANEKLLIDKSCKNLIKELGTYSWDEKAQKRGEDKPLKQNDHAVDALRYATFTHLNKLKTYSPAKLNI